MHWVRLVRFRVNEARALKLAFIEVKGYMYLRNM